jgi:NADH:quinone reductase (non-electrogenic)
MLFTPLLPEAASGTLEPRHVVVPLRLMCPHAEFVIGRVTGLDADGKLVAMEGLDGPLELV